MTMVMVTIDDKKVKDAFTNYMQALYNNYLPKGTDTESKNKRKRFINDMEEAGIWLKLDDQDQD